MENEGRNPFQRWSWAEVRGLSDRKWAIADLTKEAAKGDSDQLSAEITRWLSQIISHLIYKHPLEEQVTELTFKGLLMENIINRITTLYSYINSEYTNPPHEPMCEDAHVAYFNLTLILFSSLTHTMAFDKWHEEYDILKGSMPRLAFAMALARTRLKLEYQVLEPGKEGNEVMTVQELADLAGVTYMAIKKQLNIKIRAQRKGDTWVIPAESALEYLMKRKSRS